MLNNCKAKSCYYFCLFCSIQLIFNHSTIFWTKWLILVLHKFVHECLSNLYHFRKSQIKEDWMCNIYKKLPSIDNVKWHCVNPLRTSPLSSQNWHFFIGSQSFRMNLDTNKRGQGGELGTKCIGIRITTMYASIRFSGWIKSKKWIEDMEIF